MSTGRLGRPSDPRVAGIERTRYDGLSIALHWATAILVLVQFVTSLVWGLFPQAERRLLIVAHMSFGIILAGVILVCPLRSGPP